MLCVYCVCVCANNETADKEEKVSIGDVIRLPRGCKHTIKALTDIRLIEVQCGQEISVEDKEVFDL